MFPTASVCTNEKVSRPSVSVPLSVLVKVLEMPLKVNVAVLPPMVPSTVEPASVSKVIVTILLKPAK